MTIKNRTHELDWDDIMVYLCGPMDYTTDGGAEWRDNLEPVLEKELGIQPRNILNPCKKPVSSSGHKLSDEQTIMNTYRAMEDWEGLTRMVKKIMNIDLRLVDKADIIIVNLSYSERTTGTIHEIVQARQQHKPVYIVDHKGKGHVSGWLMALVGHERIYESMAEVIEDIKRVKEYGPQSERDAKDFVIFDFDKVESA